VSGYSFTTLEELGDDYGFRKVRRALGVTAFGVNALVLPPGFPGFHHWHDNQDELYFVHRGRARVEIGDEVQELGEGGLLHVESTTRRIVSNASDSEDLGCSSSAGKTGTSNAMGISSIPSATWLEGRPLAASGPSVEDLEHSRYFLTEWMPPLLRTTAERSPPRVIADLGAGDGGTLWPLDRAGLVGETIYAVDISAEHVALCERLSLKVKGIVSDVAHVEIADGSRRRGHRRR
jgi:quercetin dioxygenase-like cupin family protein